MSDNDLKGRVLQHLLEHGECTMRDLMAVDGFANGGPWISPRMTVSRAGAAALRELFASGVIVSSDGRTVRVSDEHRHSSRMGYPPRACARTA